MNLTGGVIYIIYIYIYVYVVFFPRGGGDGTCSLRKQKTVYDGAKCAYHGALSVDEI